MGVFAFVVIIMGVLTLVGLLLIIRQREARGAVTTLVESPPETVATPSAMIVVTLYGQLLHLNDTAREWLSLEDMAPDLEQIAERIQPNEPFYALISGGVGQASFRVGKRWVEAIAHILPGESPARVVLVLRELVGGAPNSSEVMDISTAMSIISDIEETIRADMGVEQALQIVLEIVSQAMPSTAGEICLWDNSKRVLQQRGWVGDTRYLLTVAEMGGAYPLGVGVAGWVGLHREAVVIGTEKDPVNLRQLMERNPYRSAIATPLLLNDELIGTLTLFHERRARYTSADSVLLNAINRAVATAILNARFYAEQEQRIRDIASLQQIAIQPNAENEMSGIYAGLTERLARLTESDICGVFLFDETRDALLPQLPFYGLPEAVASRFILAMPPRSPQRQMWEQQSYWTSETLRDEPLVESLNLRALVEVAGLRNAGYFPLAIAGQRIGMVALHNRKANFTPREIQRISVLMSQAALVVENVRLFQRERLIDTELIGLQEMTHAIGALSHEGEFYAEISERVARLMRSDSCAILLYERKARRLVAQLPIFGLAPELVQDYSIPLPVGSVMDEIWTEEDTWFSNRIQTDPLVYEAGLDALAERAKITRTLFAVMTAGGRRMGVLQVSNKQGEQDYDDKDARLLQIFATQAAAIIENARLYREVQVRADQAERLRRVAEMSSAVITTEQSFQPVLAEIAQFMNSQQVFINVVDHSTNSLMTYPRWVYGVEMSAPIIQDMGNEDFERSVFAIGEAFFSNDAFNDARITPSARVIVHKMKMMSFLLVPLNVGERKLGELGVANRSQGGYGEADVQVLLTIAAQITSAVDRLLLYEATGENLRRRMEELDAIARISTELTTTLDFNQIVSAVRREALAATKADDATITLLLPPEKWRVADVPEVEARVGMETLGRQLTPLEIRALTRGLEAHVVWDYDTEPFKPTGIERSAVAVPIFYLETIVGIIHAVHHQPLHFDDRASAFLVTLSSKASLGYQNAAYYQQQMVRGENLRQRVEQLNRIFELGQMLHSQATPEDLLEAVAYSVQQSVGYDTVLMLIVDENEGVLRRAAHAGLPLDVYQASRDKTLSLERLMDFLKPTYRSSESYFFPIERFEDWYLEGLDVLSPAFDDARSVDPRGKEEWHDGDMLFVMISGQGGNLLGLMALDRPQNNRRPDRDTYSVLEIFAHQASTMIENTRLFDESRRSAEQEALLNTIMQSAGRSFELAEIMHSIAQGVAHILPVSQMTLAVSDASGQGYTTVRAHFVAGEVSVHQEQRPTLERTALGAVLRQQQEALYLAEKGVIRDFDDLRAWHKRGEQASLIVPLSAGGEALGAMHFGSDDLSAFSSPDSRTLLTRVAQLVAGTIQNARLFNQAVNLQVLNRSVVESIQQGIVVLDSSGRIININDFMRTRYAWDDSALNKDLFAYQPDLREILGDNLGAVLSDGRPREHLGLTSLLKEGQLSVRNFYLYPLRYGEMIRGAVVLVEDVSERAKLEEAIETRANQLAALTEVSMRITSSLDRSEVIEVAISEMAWIIPYDVMSVWRRNGSFMVLEGHNHFPNGQDLPALSLRISEDERLSQVVDSQRVVTLSSDLPLPSQGIAGDEHTRSWMGVPLVNQGHVVGLLILSKTETGLYESRPEQNVAFAFASQVAIALANADLFEQTFERTNELGTLLEAAQATSASTSLSNIFRTVADLMFTALDMEDCSIMLWYEVDNELEVQFSANRSGDDAYTLKQGARMNLKEYPARLRALEQRDVVALVDNNNPTIMSLYGREIEDLRLMKRGARLLVPLVVNDQPIGIIKLEQTRNDETSVTQQKARLARALGAQVAVAIQNARLSTETNARFEELMTINTLSQAISSTLRIDDMLPVVRDQLTTITDADEMYLALYDTEHELISFPLAVRGRGKDIEEFSISPRVLGKDEVSYIIKRRHSLSLGADYFSIDDLRKSMGIINGEGDAKSYMGVPLQSGDEVVGVIAIRNLQRSRAFNLNDERILTTVAGQLGAAIQNARLFERVSRFADEANRLVQERTEELEEERDRLDTLYQITSELARTLDMEQLLERALGMVSKAVGADDGVIMLTDPATDRLYCRAALNPNNLIAMSTGERTHAAQSLAIWLIENDYDHVVIIEDLHAQDYWKPEISQARSALAVILESNEDPMGVMVLLSNEVSSFTENHIKLLVPAANQVAASINSADLYQLIRDQAERLGRLLRAEQEEAQKNSAILEGITDGVMLANNEGEIVLFNSAAERILGLPRRQAMGRRVTDLAGIYGDNALKWARLISEWSDSIDKPEVGADYVAERIELGEKVVSTQLSPIFINDQFLGTVSVFRDVTKDVMAERAKNEFITSVSHEFRTPLTPIKGYADLLMMGAGGELNMAQQSMMGTIKENVERLTSLVNDVLNIAKIDKGDYTMMMNMVNVGDLLKGVLDQVKGRGTNLKKNMNITTHISEKLPAIRADREKLLQIFGNIVDNAFKYTRDNGTIDVRAVAHEDGRHVLISIADSGVGIPEHFKDAAWRRFERYDEHALELDVAGTGLGLSLVKELVTLHHGEVWFESQVGVGTTFYVKLPIEQPTFTSENNGLLAVNPKPEQMAGD